MPTSDEAPEYSRHLGIWGWAHRSGKDWWNRNLNLRTWLEPFVR